MGFEPRFVYFRAQLSATEHFRIFTLSLADTLLELEYMVLDYEVMGHCCLFIDFLEKDTLDVWVNGKKVETTVCK